MPPPSSSLIRRAAVALVFAAPRPAPAQVISVRPVTPVRTGPLLSELKHQQLEFEGYRRQHIPLVDLGRSSGGRCDEQVGRFCYWYDESEPPAPPEPDDIARRREQLIARLDSAFRVVPAEPWTSGVLVRYLVEAGRVDRAIDVAATCTTIGWWCPALRGFAYHAAGRSAQADSAWSIALRAMDEGQRCEWHDLKLVLDDAMLRDYREVDCVARRAQENRIWWLARPMLSSPGNDAHAEFLSRRLYAVMLTDAPSVHEQGFDADERELLIRYGWPRAWTQSTVHVQGRESRVITGYEPSPAPPMLPTAATVRNPALSDSIGWRGKGLPGVRARYSPDVARRLLPLVHQAALFRRGDSALVVMAYDVSGDSALAAVAGTSAMSAALVLTKGEEADASIVRHALPGATGTISAMTSWGPTLLSGEVAATSRGTLARARYGLRATDHPGSRVSISDLLLFEPYDGMPRTLDEVLPHARASQVVARDSKIGIYWETYNTSPLGEGIQVAINVAPEEQSGGGWLRRGLTALRLVRESQPVSMGLSDVSARGRAFTPRAVVVDLTSLRPGRYVLQMEITAQGTAPVRAERVLTVR
ncbi:MAG: hypothetical protein IT361_03695 [Gemmatimonadaceae bacterium]|nr:hypothetical protein [Gemmatimonadaceae bacterium]